jgi:hypothetical protein
VANDRIWISITKLMKIRRITRMMTISLRLFQAFATSPLNIRPEHRTFRFSTQQGEKTSYKEESQRMRMFSRRLPIERIYLLKCMESNKLMPLNSQIRK